MLTIPRSGASLFPALASLAASLPEQSDAEAHDIRYVDAVTEVAAAIDGDDPKTAREFAMHFLQRPPVNAKPGAAAAAFEARLSTKHRDLWQSFVETVTEKDGFTALFRGRVSLAQIEALRQSVADVCTVEVVVKAGDRELDGGGVSDVTILACQPPDPKSRRRPLVGDPTTNEPDQYDMRLEAISPDEFFRRYGRRTLDGRPYEDEQGVRWEFQQVDGMWHPDTKRLDEDPRGVLAQIDNLLNRTSVRESRGRDLLRSIYSRGDVGMPQSEAHQYGRERVLDAVDQGLIRQDGDHYVLTTQGKRGTHEAEVTFKRKRRTHVDGDKPRDSWVMRRGGVVLYHIKQMAKGFDLYRSTERPPKKIGSYRSRASAEDAARSDYRDQRRDEFVGNALEAIMSPYEGWTGDDTNSVLEARRRRSTGVSEESERLWPVEEAADVVLPKRLPYGYWVAPDGEMTEVPSMGHARVGEKLLAAAGGEKDTSLYNGEDQIRVPLLRLGYMRVVTGMRQLGINVVGFTPDTARVAKALIQRAADDGVTINVVKFNKAFSKVTSDVAWSKGMPLSAFKRETNRMLRDRSAEETTSRVVGGFSAGVLGADIVPGKRGPKRVSEAAARLVPPEVIRGAKTLARAHKTNAYVYQTIVIPGRETTPDPVWFSIIDARNPERRSRGKENLAGKVSQRGVVTLEDGWKEGGPTEALEKPFRLKDDRKKFGVRVKNPETGREVLVKFGDPNMEIKRDDPGRRKNFRARHNCDGKKDKTTPGYWSCKMWQDDKSVSQMTEERWMIPHFGVEVEVDLTFNPSARQLARMNQNTTLRGLYSERDDELVVWDADKVIHDQVSLALYGKTARGDDDLHTLILYGEDSDELGLWCPDIDDLPRRLTTLLRKAGYTGTADEAVNEAGFSEGYWFHPRTGEVYDVARDWEPGDGRYGSHTEFVLTYPERFGLSAGDLPADALPVEDDRAINLAVSKGWVRVVDAEDLVVEANTPGDAAEAVEMFANDNTQSAYVAVRGQRARKITDLQKFVKSKGRLKENVNRRSNRSVAGSRSNRSVAGSRSNRSVAGSRSNRSNRSVTRTGDCAPEMLRRKAARRNHIPTTHTTTEARAGLIDSLLNELDEDVRHFNFRNRQTPYLQDPTPEQLNTYSDIHGSDMKGFVGDSVVLVAMGEVPGATHEALATALTDDGVPGVDTSDSVTLQLVGGRWKAHGPKAKNERLQRLLKGADKLSHGSAVDERAGDPETRSRAQRKLDVVVGAIRDGKLATSSKSAETRYLLPRDIGEDRIAVVFRVGSKTGFGFTRDGAPVIQFGFEPGQLLANRAAFIHEWTHWETWLKSGHRSGSAKKFDGGGPHAVADYANDPAETESFYQESADHGDELMRMIDKVYQAHGEGRARKMFDQLIGPTAQAWAEKVSKRVETWDFLRPRARRKMLARFADDWTRYRDQFTTLGVTHAQPT